MPILPQNENAVRRFFKTQAASLAKHDGLSGSKTYDPPSVAAAGSTTTTVTVTGAALGDIAAASFSLSLGGLTVSAYVSAADTVTVVLANNTAAPIDLASGTLSARIQKL